MMANLLAVPSPVLGLLGRRQQQGQSLMGLVGPMQADALDEQMFAAAPNGYVESPQGMYFPADQNAQAAARQQMPQEPAQRQRVNPLNVLFRGLAPNLSGALDTERARLQMQADAPRTAEVAAENERIARALGPQALLAFRTSPEKFGESLGYGYRPQVIGQGGIQSVAATGQRVSAPQFDEFGNEYRLNDPLTQTSTVIGTRGPSYSEQAQIARIQQDAEQAGARLELDYRRLEQADSQFNQTYEQREREYLRQAEARAAANGGRGKITEGQAKDGFNASRLEDAGAIIAGLEGNGFDFGASGLTGGQFREGFRSYDAAAEEWTDAMLRLTTGAAATKQEMASNRRAYFPQPGDSEAVRRQKAARRAQLQQDAIARAGPGYFGSSAGSSGGGGNAPPLPHGFVLD